MANEDYLHRQELNAYLHHQDEPAPIEVPIDADGDALEPGCFYWRVQYGWADPVYIFDDLDGINDYLEATYEDGGGIDDYHEAVKQIAEEEAEHISYLLYRGYGQTEERKWTA
ncbi:hypothetical protein [Secundilactobacillus muriivasis]